MPTPFHVQIIRALQRDSSNAADFLVADCASERDLACHGRTADDGFVETEFLDEGRDAADVGIFGVGVVAGVEGGVGKAAAVGLSRCQ